MGATVDKYVRGQMNSTGCSVQEAYANVLSDPNNNTNSGIPKTEFFEKELDKEFETKASKYKHRNLLFYRLMGENYSVIVRAIVRGQNVYYKIPKRYQLSSNNPYILDWLLMYGRPTELSQVRGIGKIKLRCIYSALKAWTDDNPIDLKAWVYESEWEQWFKNIPTTITVHPHSISEPLETNLEEATELESTPVRIKKIGSKLKTMGEPKEGLAHLLGLNQQYKLVCINKDSEDNIEIEDAIEPAHRKGSSTMNITKTTKDNNGESVKRDKSKLQFLTKDGIVTEGNRGSGDVYLTITAADSNRDKSKKLYTIRFMFRHNCITAFKADYIKWAIEGKRLYFASSNAEEGYKLTCKNAKTGYYVANAATSAVTDPSTLAKYLKQIKVFADKEFSLEYDKEYEMYYVEVK